MTQLSRPDSRFPSGPGPNLVGPRAIVQPTREADTLADIQRIFSAATGLVGQVQQNKLNEQRGENTLARQQISNDLQAARTKSVEEELRVSGLTGKTAQADADLREGEIHLANSNLIDELGEFAVPKNMTPDERRAFLDANPEIENPTIQTGHEIKIGKLAWEHSASDAFFGHLVETRRNFIRGRQPGVEGSGIDGPPGAELTDQELDDHDIGNQFEFTTGQFEDWIEKSGYMDGMNYVMRASFLKQATADFRQYKQKSTVDKVEYRHQLHVARTRQSAQTDIAALGSEASEHRLNGESIAASMTEIMTAHNAELISLAAKPLTASDYFGYLHDAYLTGLSSVDLKKVVVGLNKHSTWSDHANGKRDPDHKLTGKGGLIEKIEGQEAKALNEYIGGQATEMSASLAQLEKTGELQSIAPVRAIISRIKADENMVAGHPKVDALMLKAEETLSRLNKSLKGEGIIAAREQGMPFTTEERLDPTSQANYYESGSGNPAERLDSLLAIGGDIIEPVIADFKRFTSGDTLDWHRAGEMMEVIRHRKGIDKLKSFLAANDTEAKLAQKFFAATEHADAEERADWVAVFNNVEAAQSLTETHMTAADRTELFDERHGFLNHSGPRDAEARAKWLSDKGDAIFPALSPATLPQYSREIETQVGIILQRENLTFQEKKRFGKQYGDHFSLGYMKAVKDKPFDQPERWEAAAHEHAQKEILRGQQSITIKDHRDDTTRTSYVPSRSGIGIGSMLGSGGEGEESKHEQRERDVFETQVNHVSRRLPRGLSLYPENVVNTRSGALIPISTRPAEHGDTMPYENVVGFMRWNPRSERFDPIVDTKHIKSLVDDAAVAMKQTPKTVLKSGGFVGTLLLGRAAPILGGDSPNPEYVELSARHARLSAMLSHAKEFENRKEVLIDDDVAFLHEDDVVAVTKRFGVYDEDADIEASRTIISEMFRKSQKLKDLTDYQLGVSRLKGHELQEAMNPYLGLYPPIVNRIPENPGISLAEFDRKNGHTRKRDGTYDESSMIFRVGVVASQEWLKVHDRIPMSPDEAEDAGDRRIDEEFRAEYSQFQDTFAEQILGWAVEPVQPEEDSIEP